MKRTLLVLLAVAVSIALAGCAAAPPVQPESPAKPIPWRTIFTVQNDADFGWSS